MSDTPESPTTPVVEKSMTSSKPTIVPPSVTKTPRRNVRTPKVPVVVEELTEFEKGFEAMINRNIGTGAPAVITVIDFMQKYVEDMAPGKKISNDEGAVIQQRFFKMLYKLIEKTPPAEFRKAWNVLLSFFWRYKKGALGEQYVNRFAEFWPAKDDNLTAYQRLVNLCLISADPSQRAGVARKVNITKTMELVFTEIGRSNIITFYSS